MTMVMMGKLRLRKADPLAVHGWLARELLAPLPVLSPCCGQAAGHSF